MKPEEYLIKWFPTIVIKDKHDREMTLISWESCQEIMESYHQSRVNAMSDQEIYSEICEMVRDLDSVTRQPLITHRNIGKMSINWFKNKLLN